ncbi:MAG: ribosomal protein L25/Gln-tRNA synthetase, partial [Olpidium bornovanus]
TKWKVYPTYDFACPAVDSWEGVTHALRTNEYRDRNPQYQWFLDNLGLRQVHIWDYARMNFKYTLLSKRKLQWFVDQGIVSGWDDPRFPTVRGICRRGMTVAALKDYIVAQGPSTNAVNLEWDKLWALNRKAIDPIAPRHIRVLKDSCVKVNIIGGPAQFETKLVPRHKKVPAMGTKTTVYASYIYLDDADAADLFLGEEVTLMDWGNAVVASASPNLEMRLNLEGDFKATKKKIHWLAAHPASAAVECEVREYDYLITKEKLEEGDDVVNFITPVSEFRNAVLADANVKELKKGDIIQFERFGFHIVDVPFSDAQPSVVFIRVPDGHAASTVSKAAEDAEKSKGGKRKQEDKENKGRKTEKSAPKDNNKERAGKKKDWDKYAGKA